MKLTGWLSFLNGILSKAREVLSAVAFVRPAAAWWRAAGGKSRREAGFRLARQGKSADKPTMIQPVLNQDHFEGVLAEAVAVSPPYLHCHGERQGSLMLPPVGEKRGQATFRPVRASPGQAGPAAARPR